MTVIEAAPPFIKLEQFLKFGNIAETGGMAKLMIQDGIVEVNGEVCVMRGKKLYDGDTVSVNFEEGTEEFVCRIRE
ncbi:MAG: RNA-binding S4 domain-containing protein [Ruminiclostridium sp.]|nr:RNA-binding S4 domain-containing protein [Ruminiclostridium sp.]